MEIDLLIFDRPPEPSNEDIVPLCTLAVHRDGDLRLLQRCIAGKRLFHGLDAEGCFHRDRELLWQNLPTEPVDDGAEIDKSACHWDVGQDTGRGE